MPKEKLIYESKDKSEIKIISGRKENTKLYADIVKLRKKVDPKWGKNEFDFDDYSEHYCLYVDGKAVACITGTRLLEGKMPSQEHFPQILLEKYKDTILTPGKFRVSKSSQWSEDQKMFISKILLRESLKEQLHKGASLFMIFTEEKLVPYYKRIGYEECFGYDFFHPVLKNCKIMLLAADPHRNSFAQDIFEKSPMFLSQKQVIKELEQDKRKLSNT